MDVIHKTMKKGTWQEVIFCYIQLLCFEAAKKEEKKKELIGQIKDNTYLMGILEPVLSRFDVESEVASPE